MCGLVGAFGPSAERLKPQLDRALDRIAHRGPDGRGEFQSEDRSCILGHRRLSIVDLTEAANQPMRSESDVLAFNGEIYNHLAIRKLLEGFPFRTHCDTETLLSGLRSRGVSILGDLSGMFAGAFYDGTARSLTLFRDTLGIKPLYVRTLEDSTVVFGSEIKALLALTPERPAVCSLETLRSYQVFENYPQGPSLFDEVELLPPGSVLRCVTGGTGRVRTELSRFESRLGAESVPPEEHLALVEETRSRIRNSVHAHLMSDVPLGVYLSGGIDSSLVAALSAESISGLMAFTGYFETSESHYDERPLSRQVAQSIGAKLLEVKIQPRDLPDTLDQLILALDEPRMGMGSFSQFVVAREAAKHRKVVLAGHGGDELFGGYPLFKALWLLQTGASRSSLPYLRSLRAKEWPWVINFFLNWARKGRLEFAPRLSKVDAPLEARIEEVFSQICTDSPLSQLDAYYRSTYLPGLLVVEDKVSMAHGLETRVPLWSQELVSWASRIPIEAKIKNGELKSLLKEVALPLVPEAVINGPKRGFPTPLRLWFRDELFGFARERLLRPSRLHEIVSPAKVERLLDSHRRMPLPFALDERRAHRIWILLCLESWIRQFDVKIGAEHG